MGEVFMSGAAKMSNYGVKKMLPELNIIDEIKPSIKERIIRATLWIHTKLFGK